MDSAKLPVRDFITDENPENKRILHVFPVFQTAQPEKKIRRQPQTVFSEFP